MVENYSHGRQDIHMASFIIKGREGGGGKEGGERGREMCTGERGRGGLFSLKGSLT